MCTSQCQRCCAVLAWRAVCLQAVQHSTAAGGLWQPNQIARAHLRAWQRLPAHCMDSAVSCAYLKRECACIVEEEGRQQQRGTAQSDVPLGRSDGALNYCGSWGDTAEPETGGGRQGGRGDCCRGEEGAECKKAAAVRARVQCMCVQYRLGECARVWRPAQSVCRATPNSA